MAFARLAAGSWFFLLFHAIYWLQQKLYWKEGDHLAQPVMHWLSGKKILCWGSNIQCSSGIFYTGCKNIISSWNRISGENAVKYILVGLSESDLRVGKKYSKFQCLMERFTAETLRIYISFSVVSGFAIMCLVQIQGACQGSRWAIVYDGTEPSTAQSCDLRRQSERNGRGWSTEEVSDSSGQRHRTVEPVSALIFAVLGI